MAQLLSNRAAVISYSLFIGWQVPPAIHQFMVMGCVCTWSTKTPQSPSHKAVLSTSGITRSGRSAKSGRPSTFGVELRPVALSHDIFKAASSSGLMHPSHHSGNHWKFAPGEAAIIPLASAGCCSSYTIMQVKGSPIIVQYIIHVDLL